MLKIRREQWEVLDRENLIGEIHRAVAKSSPHLIGKAGSDETRARVERAVGAAQGFGLRGYREIAAFVFVSFEIGERFHEQATIRSVLTNAAIPAERRMTMLKSLTSERDWAEAANT